MAPVTRWMINTLCVSISLLSSLAGASKCCNPDFGNPEVESPRHLEHILNNYLNIWNGDVSLINSTFSPVLSFHGDRFPSSTGVGSVAIEIGTSAEFLAFVERSRTGWNQYTFHPYRWVADGLNIAVRWRLEAVIGQNFTLAPTTLKPGDPLTYNGTDFLVLNPCTGLIDEANIAQDLISFFHALGLEEVTV